MSQATIHGQTWETLKRVRGRAIVYARGDQSRELTAVPGRNQGSATADNAQVIEDQSQEWLVDPTEPVGFEPAVPQALDTLTDVATGQVYSVVAKGTERAWRYSGPERAWRRIRTQEIDA